MIPLRSVLLALVAAPLLTAQTTHTVTQDGLSFDPLDVTIRVGDTVEWLWTGFGDHSVTEGTDGQIDGDEAFDEDLSFFNPVATVVFDKALVDSLTSLAPGNVVPYFCAPHFAFGQTGTVTLEPWVDCGSAKAGTGGVEPHLDGTGPMTPASANTLELSDMFPASTAFLVVGVAVLDEPFKGGTLVPAPLLPPIALPTAGGSVSLPFVWPGAPFGTQIYLQAWVSDPGATQGLSATNAVRVMIP